MSAPERVAPSAPALRRGSPRRTWWILFAVVLAVALLFPWLVDRPRFWIPNIGIRTLWLGAIAMSLVFLSKYVGLLSLAQVTFAGIAAYGVGFLTVKAGLPYLVSVPAGVLIGTLAGFLVALVAVRTKAIYFLMITLAIGQVVYSYASQAIEVTGARRGLPGLRREDYGFIDLGNLDVFYYVSLAVVVLLFLLCKYVAGSTFGLTLQGIRDSPERMAALGYPVNGYRVAAVTFAAFIASVGGMILLFDRAQVDPDVVSLASTLDVLIVAIVGGIGSLGGVFLGALVLAFLNGFAQDLTDRYLTLIGLVFIVVLLFAPAGLAGIADQAKRVLVGRRNRRADPGPVHEDPPTSRPVEPASRKEHSNEAE